MYLMLLRLSPIIINPGKTSSSLRITSVHILNKFAEVDSSLFYALVFLLNSFYNLYEGPLFQVNVQDDSNIFSE